MKGLNIANIIVNIFGAIFDEHDNKNREKLDQTYF